MAGLDGPTERGPGSNHDVVVVGAGQAGLAIGRVLQREGREVILVDAGSAKLWMYENGAPVDTMKNPTAIPWAMWRAHPG